MKVKAISFPLAILLASCGNSEKAPLVSGNIEGADSVIIQAYYDIDGDVYLDDIITDSVGNFSYDPQITSPVDITLYINGSSYGVRVGQDSPMSISVDTEGKATFQGDNIVESQWLTECFDGYNARRFKHVIERDGDYDPLKYLSMIDETRQATSALLPQVADESLRGYYEAIDRQFYDRTKANILLSDYYYNGKDAGKEYPAQAIDSLKRFDVNSDVARRTGALYELSSEVFPRSLRNPSSDIEGACVRVDSLVSNPANRQMLYNYLAEMAFMYYQMPADSMRQFVNNIAGRLSDHQREVFDKRISEVENRTKTGDRIPVDPMLVRPDGSKTTLTEACEGKIAYIDMWATWCGPCCAQIPYMEKVAAGYKDDDRVVCISISCDEDIEAWHRKLKQDNPEWPQYVFSGESGQQFMTALGVSGIPRFIVINPDMTIADINAPRPQSGDKLRAEIDSIAASL